MPNTARERTVIVGLGNPILSDDGVGVYAARLLAERLAGASVVVSESSLGGLRFLDLLAGFDRQENDLGRERNPHLVAQRKRRAKADVVE